MPYSLESRDQQYKKIEYKYDLISGNVNEVHYQPGQKDQYLHRYSYDADNRITSVETSIDNVNWTKDAKYFYYKHGPLKRVELGEYKVQGMDYVYTLQGWIKAVNSNNLSTATDQGQDGAALSTNVNKNIATDVYGYSLGYYAGDYKPIQARAVAND
ncbi:MAG TPA: hypothetical protein VF691_00100, partial [Cytophagaceae bacterium]